MTDTDIKEYVFYTFICNDPNITDCYVGSTRSFRERKSRHKSSCNNENGKSYNLKIYQTIRNNGGWDNWEMKLIDTKLCSFLEARIYETKLMEERQASMNTRKAYLTEEQLNMLQKQCEYKYNRTDAGRLRSKKYYDKNKDKINARKRELTAFKKESIMLNQHIEVEHPNHSLEVQASQEH